jgi:hypothetical protein
MRPKAAWALVTVSVCFNVFFTIGYFRAHSALELAETPMGRARLMVRHVGLSDEQQQGYVHIEASFEESLRPLTQELSPYSDRYWGEFVKDDADPGRLAAVLRESRHILRRIGRVKIEHTLELMKLLSSEQREKLVEWVRGKGR